MKAETKSKQYIVCPNCGDDEWLVQHLLDDPNFRARTFGPWGCHNKACDTEISGTINSNKEIEIEVRPRGYNHGFALLKFHDLYLVVDEMQFKGRDLEDTQDYFYHSHQCPTGLFGRVQEVYGAEGSDPHGCLRYVASIPGTPAAQQQIEEGGSLQDLLLLFKTDGTPRPTNWPEENGGLLPIIAQLRRQHVKEKSPKA